MYDLSVGLVIGVLQLGLWLLLAAASLHLLRAARFAWSRPLDPHDHDEPLRDFPVVTVQLPVRDEGALVERVARAACALDWPRDRLQIQILDDGGEDSRAAIDALGDTLRKEGHDVAVVRRGSRAGFKAGNLQHGLSTARGELIAVLDADAQPPRDFLRRLVPHLADDERLGFVQARQSFDNESSSLLTRVQALILHGLMLVEQPRLSAYGEPLPFNGSGGIWRREALDAAGGWLRDSQASLTEDLDLAYRARLAGWRGSHVAEVAVGSELPSTMAAFRAQQKRWVRGAGEVLRALGRRVSGATMLLQLLRHARQPYLFLLTLWLPFTMLGLVPLENSPSWARPLVHSPSWTWPLLVALVWLAIGSYYGAALRRLGRSALGGYVMAPVVMALSLGLCPSLALSLVRGLFGIRGEFVRTPKGTMRARGVDALAYVEAAIGVIYVGLAILMVLRGSWLAAIGLGGFFAAGYLWVGLGSIISGTSGTTGINSR